jgi:hypothetical protein
VADGDIWWHLAAGREMLARRGFLFTDPFSAGAAGRPWIDLHWLFQLGAHGVYVLAGLRGLVLVKAALVALGAIGLGWMVHAAARGPARDVPQGPHTGEAPPTGTVALGIFAPLLAAALVAARHLLLVRPVILTLLFLAAFVGVLEAHRRGDRGRLLVALPLLQVVWANCQGLFGLGALVVVAYLLGEVLPLALRPRAPQSGTGSPRGLRARHLLLALVSCALASLATPYGWRGLALAVELLTRITPSAGNPYSTEIAENLPPWILERTQPGLFWHLRWFLLLLGGSFALARRRLVPAHALLALTFTALALMANRNVLLLYWVGAPIVALNLAPPLAAGLARARGLRGRRAVAVLGPGLAMLALVATGVVVAQAARGEPPLDRPTPFRVPEGSVARLHTEPGDGAVFAADHYGGYLIWALHPRFRPFIDTRLILRTRAELEEFLGALDDPPRFDALRARHDLRYAVLPVNYPERYLGLIGHLGRSPAWKLLFTDGHETLFAYEHPGPSLDLSARAETERLLAGCRARFLGDSSLQASCALQLALLQLALGHPAEARHALAEQTSADARELLAQILLADGDASGAEDLALGLVDRDPDDAAAWTLLATVALTRGERGLATERLRRALDLDPYAPAARALLGRLGGPAP